MSMEQEYNNIINCPLTAFVTIAKQIGGDVDVISQLVLRAFNLQVAFLTNTHAHKQPLSQGELLKLLEPTSAAIKSIQEFRDANRTSPYFNHLSAISDSIAALGWVAVQPTPAVYVKEMRDAGQFYTNRVLKEWKEKDSKHAEWVRSWIQTLDDLHAYVKSNHTTGLVWKSGSGSSAAPPPPPPLPPMSLLNDDSNHTGSGDSDINNRSALFAEINKGEVDILRNLRKVKGDAPYANSTLREGPAPFKTPNATQQMKTSVCNTEMQKSPTFKREGKRWIVEYQKDRKDILIENAEMNNIVYLFKCVGCTITVKGKINSIILDSCKKTSVVFDTLVSAIEFINCQSVQMQVFGKVPTISIDKTDGCQMFLSNESLDVEIVSSKSSEMNVMLPTKDQDYVEYPIAEQFKTTINPKTRSLVTIMIENRG